MIIGRHGDCYRDYQEYISSWEWKWFAERKKADRDYECERCEWGSPEVQLHVHHIHYDTLGKEDPEDVEVLCKRCHEEEHGIENPTNMIDPGNFHQSLDLNRYVGLHDWQAAEFRLQRKNPIAFHWKTRFHHAAHQFGRSHNGTFESDPPLFHTCPCYQCEQLRIRKGFYD